MVLLRINKRWVAAGAFSLVLVFTALLLRTEQGNGFISNVNSGVFNEFGGSHPKTTLPPHPKYKPTPTYTPPPIKDNFPLLATSTPPPIPKWNVANKTLHQTYGLPYAPPLLIGFTRSWPLLLQSVVSYITAGWPADQIYVIENTGVQQSNTLGKLSLQNPLFLDHAALKKLGVNIIQTPVLMSFAQLQNFFLSVSIEKQWEYYFWSHMDTLALSYEDGHETLTPKYNEEGYRSLYELSLYQLAKTRKEDPRWGLMLFAYDHLAAVNPAAYEDVGGWDTLIPYYLTDCDMHTRLAMRNWSMPEVKAGIVTDVSVALDDLRVLYREPNLVPEFTDPNPPPPPPPEKDQKANKRSVAPRDGDGPPDPNLEYWRRLQSKADNMFHYKHGNRGRNTWQLGQQGGKGEPYYYPAAGLAEALEIMTEAGRETYRKKWGHRDCDLVTGAGLKFEDQWLVMQDWP